MYVEFAHGFQSRLNANFGQGAEQPAIMHYVPDQGKLRSATWRELKHRVASCSAQLRNAGVSHGDLTCIIGSSSVELVVCLLACIRLGAIGSIFPPPSPLQDREYYLQQQTRALGTIRPDHVIVLSAVEGIAHSLAEILNATHVLPLDPVNTEEYSDDIFEKPEADRVLFVQHSSGTTGIKKGVAITDRQLALQLETYVEFLKLRSCGGPSGVRIASWLPLYHDMGLVACLLLSLYERGTLCLIDPFDWVSTPGSLLEIIAKVKAEYVWLPNFAFRFLSRCFPRGSGHDLSSVRTWINCSEPCRAETMTEFARVFARNGVDEARLACCYAMAETVFAVSQTIPGEQPRSLRVERASLQLGTSMVVSEESTALPVMSNGPALPGIEVAVRTSKWQPEGVLGELCVKAPFLFEGYYRRPESNEGVFVDGYYLTGDIGFLWKGEIYITGRLKEIIIIHGKNIFATDVEALANEIPGVKGGRCVAFGIDSSASGSEELVLVAEKDETFDASPAQIERSLSEKIVFEFGIHPRHVLVVEDRWIVKSTSGKISRADNRRKYLEMLGLVIS